MVLTLKEILNKTRKITNINPNLKRIRILLWDHDKILVILGCNYYEDYQYNYYLYNDYQSTYTIPLTISTIFPLVSAAPLINHNLFISEVKLDKQFYI